MPPKPRPRSQQFQQQQPQQPAYTPTPSSTEPATLHIPTPPRSNESLNLSVLQRHYPGVTSIVHVASYTVVYTLNLETHAWDRVGIEGSLFLCQLIPTHTGASRFSIIILNRRGLNNFDYEITGGKNDIEINDEYIMVRGPLQEVVYGIWVFIGKGNTEGDREATLEAMLECAKETRRSRAEVEERLHEEMAKGPAPAPYAQEEDDGAPMGRTLSLRELFGRQREVDAGFSVHDHHSPAAHAMADAQANAQQNVHHNAQQGSWAQQHQQEIQGQHIQGPEVPQEDIIGKLFQKARQRQEEENAG